MLGFGCALPQPTFRFFFSGTGDGHDMADVIGQHFLANKKKYPVALVALDVVSFG